MQQIFRYTQNDGLVSEWRYGEGTRDSGGDYYENGRYVEEAYWKSPESLQAYFGPRGGRLTQVIAPHLVLDEGL